MIETLAEDILNKKDFFGLRGDDKKRWLLEQLEKLIDYQSERCVQYKVFTENWYRNNVTEEYIDTEQVEDLDRRLAALPFLMARLFKHHDLQVQRNSPLAHVMTSSGTSNQGASKIYLDQDNARLQKSVLTKILGHEVGGQRLPMLIWDIPIRAGQSMTASQAGSLGFSLFASKRFYSGLASELDLESIIQWASFDGPLLMFGFTAKAWLGLEKLGKEECIDEIKQLLTGKQVSFIHGGGWKKLSQQAVGKKVFKNAFKRIFGSQTLVRDYYGMIEQTGNIYLECAAGYFHTNDISYVIVRDPKSLKPLANGKTGLIQTISLTAQSYPGASILTDDLGTVHGDDCCTCGKPGQYFTVHGRQERADTRGCSDAIETNSHASIK